MNGGEGGQPEYHFFSVPNLLPEITSEDENLTIFTVQTGADDRQKN